MGLPLPAAACFPDSHARELIWCCWIFSEAFDGVSRCRLLWGLRQCVTELSCCPGSVSSLGASRGQWFWMWVVWGGGGGGASGVPLSLVLGPVLFLVCVNGLLSGLSSQVCLIEDGAAVCLMVWVLGMGGGNAGGPVQFVWGGSGTWFGPLSARWYVMGDHKLHSWGHDWHGVHLVWSGPRGCHQCEVLGG